MLLSRILDARLVADLDVTGIKVDSRAINSGDLFVALTGTRDGEGFISDAIKRGAIAVLYDNKHLIDEPKGVMAIGVDSLSDKLPEIAKRFFSYKKDSLQLIGVTGTNGKTSIAYVLQQMFALLGEQTGYIGTLGYSCTTGTQFNTSESTLTTPDVFTNYKYLRQAVKDGCKNMVVEASSHGLAQNRLAGLDFSYGIFSNLTRDHLDYHKDFDDYFAAKKKLFDSTQTAIINIDDSYGRQLLSELPSSICYSITQAEAPNGARILYARDFISNLESTRFTLCYSGESVACHTSMAGTFAVSNILAACCVLIDKGYSLQRLSQVISKIKSPPGRLELVAREPWIFIDFAHTPDALEKALHELRSMTTGKLSILFGCGGNRDTGKREIMGQRASEIADFVYITSDNPRNEDPQAIIEQIVQGVGIENKTKVIVEADRAAAIELAVKAAKQNDCLLIAGKGHETGQVIRGIVHPFSDHETLVRLLAGR